MNKLAGSISPLTEDERSVWLHSLCEHTSMDLAYKFHRGREQHGQDLGVVPLAKVLEEARHEALDQISYLAELKRRVELHDLAFYQLAIVARSLSLGLALTPTDQEFLNRAVTQAMAK